jgi:hypothetical protein
MPIPSPLPSAELTRLFNLPALSRSGTNLPYMGCLLSYTRTPRKVCGHYKLTLNNRTTWYSSPSSQGTCHTLTREQGKLHPPSSQLSAPTLKLISSKEPTSMVTMHLAEPQTTTPPTQHTNANAARSSDTTKQPTRLTTAPAAGSAQMFTPLTNTRAPSDPAA